MGLLLAAWRDTGHVACWVVIATLITASAAASAFEQALKFHNHTMSLPPEIKEEILQHLGKQDLKAVRFVAKDWSACAARFLFNRIYWSPQDKDLDVFNSLANAKFAGSVQELVFDGSQFNIDMTEKFYFHFLCHHIYSLCPNWLDSLKEQAKFCQSTLSDLVAAIWSFAEGDHDLSEEVIEDLWKDFDGQAIIEEGYSRWAELALKQRSRMGDPDISALFTSGLVKLSKS